MGGDVAALRERLLSRRREEFELDGVTIALIEPSALEASDIWEPLVAAESAGRTMDAYRQLVLVGAHTLEGERIFDDLAQLEGIGLRSLVLMAEAIMRLTEMELDAGKVEPDPSDSLPTD